MSVVADQTFRSAFEKEAKIKELALAGALAMSPMASKADDTGKALKHGLNAVKRTSVGKQVSKKIKDIGDKVTSKVKSYTNLTPEIPHHQIQTSAKASGSAAASATPKVSLKDLGNMNVKYKDLTGTVGTKGIQARYNINKETFVEAFNKGKDSGVRIGYNKAF